MGEWTAIAARSGLPPPGAIRSLHAGNSRVYVGHARKRHGGERLRRKPGGIYVLHVSAKDQENFTTMRQRSIVQLERLVEGELF